jgi:hypothetical protein
MAYEGTVAQLVVGAPFVYFRSSAMLRNTAKFSLGSMAGAGTYGFLHEYSSSENLEESALGALDSSLDMGSGIMTIHTGGNMCLRGVGACRIGAAIAVDGASDVCESVNDASLYKDFWETNFNTKFPGAILDSSTDILSGKIGIGNGCW